MGTQGLKDDQKHTKKNNYPEGVGASLIHSSGRYSLINQFLHASIFELVI